MPITKNKITLYGHSWQEQEIYYIKHPDDGFQGGEIRPFLRHDGSCLFYADVVHIFKVTKGQFVSMQADHYDDGDYIITTKILGPGGELNDIYHHITRNVEGQWLAD